MRYLLAVLAMGAGACATDGIRPNATSAPARRRAATNPILPGLRATPSISMTDPGTPAAAAAHVAADDGSPGTRSVRASSTWPPLTAANPGRDSTFAPNARSARSV